ncbi:MAG: phosphoenolpyruvate carboxylase [Pirellulales bacterium]|nr:phosphoenolpyruvate carboxylase [Pirellulales bacterium]
MSSLWKRDANALLRDELAGLGRMLGETVAELAGPAEFDTVESVRKLAHDRRRGRESAETELAELISSSDEASLRHVIRAFTFFLDLANLAEDRQRIRILRAREQAAGSAPRAESIEAALLQLKEAGKSPEDIQKLLDELRIELVFTAHPTESKRRSIRSKLRRIRETLYLADHEDLPAELEGRRREIQAELAKLWFTDLVRPWRPTVLQEVRRGLAAKTVLWNTIPEILSDLRDALAKVWPDAAFRIRPSITFGSWIGGDRDGHPYVTAEVTEQTIVWLREAAMEFQLTACKELIRSLSLSKRQMHVSSSIHDKIEEAVTRWPELRDEVERMPPNEFARRWLQVIQGRLAATAAADVTGSPRSIEYADADELAADVEFLADEIKASGVGATIVDELQTWLDRINTFGFHLAKLDVRQNSAVYRTAINEMLELAGFTESASELTEQRRSALLVETLRRPLPFAPEDLSEQAREVLDLFTLLRQTARTFGLGALGGHVISMTKSPSDVLSVLWLWHQVHQNDLAEGEEVPPLPIIPLFETIEDLESARAILLELFGTSAYRNYLRGQDDRQVVMLGYSDSTKDGGYLTACWSLFNAQKEIYALAESQGVSLTFFHGRGGSLGRGGGPAARSILSLPSETFHGTVRLTEQGEVLSDRYDDPRIARRHLEQLVWSSLLASGTAARPPREQWIATMRELSEASFRAYRQLVEQPGFVEFFRRATPINEIENLPIGSRPSRRTGSHQLQDLRAIPWVFSWTQSRYLIPAWYGLGTAFESVSAQAGGADMLVEMYRKWPFFRATMANAELALAKTDLGIAQRYAQLASDSEDLVRIGAMLSSEFESAQQGMLALTGNQALLDGTPWLKESIRVRNRYIDPLNLIQIDLLKRQARATDASQEELSHLLRLSIKGVAAGMRTTG